MIRHYFFRAFVVATFVGLVIATVPAQSKKEKSEAKKLFQQGESAFAARNFRDAADLYGRSLALVAVNAVGHVKKGYAHVGLKENDAAINEFTVALGQGYRPQVEIYRLRGDLYYQIKNYDAALEDLNRALAIEPKNLFVLKSAGEASVAKGDYSAATAFLQRAVAIDPKDGDSYYYLATAKQSANDTKGQVEAGEMALANGTRMVGETYHLLGDGYQKMRNVNAAMDAYKKALSAMPDDYLSYRNLAEVYRSDNRFDDAIATAKQGLKVFPSDGNLFTDISWYYSLAGKPDEAVAAAKMAVQILPNRSTGYTTLCRAYNDAKSYDAAITACKNALRLSPSDGESYFYLGRAYDFKNDTAEAMRSYKLAVLGLVAYTTKNPAFSDGWYLLGNAYFSDNQRDKAMDAYLKCLELSPRFSKARYNLGIIYTRKKDKISALQQYNSLRVIDTNLAKLLKNEIDKM